MVQDCRRCAIQGHLAVLVNNCLWRSEGLVESGPLITAHINDLIVLGMSLLLELWLFVLLLKRHIFRLFPIFFTFTLYTALLTVTRLATLGHYRVYFFAYWWTEAG